MRLLDTPEPDPSARPANRRTIVRAVKTEAALLAIAFGRYGMPSVMCNSIPSLHFLQFPGALAKIL